MFKKGQLVKCLITGKKFLVVRQESIDCYFVVEHREDHPTIRLHSHLEPIGNNYQAKQK
jgi:hypothetical protein